MGWMDLGRSIFGPRFSIFQILTISSHDSHNSFDLILQRRVRNGPQAITRREDKAKNRRLM